MITRSSGSQRGARLLDPSRGAHLLEKAEGALNEDPVFLPVGQAPASSKPRERALDDPSLGQDDEALRVIGSLDDFDIHLRH